MTPAVARTRGRLSLYRVLRRVHLWLTIVFAVPVIVLSLTGALLVFGPELQSAIAPEDWKVQSGEQVLSYGTILERITRQNPDVTVWAIGLGEAPDMAWTIWLARNAGVLKVDPYTGRILKQYHPKDTFVGLVTALHRRWLAEGDVSRWVRHGVSTAALVLMIQVILGLWIWAIPPNRLKRLRVDGVRPPRLLVLRLHNLAGVVTAALLLLIAFTGMAMYWPEPTRVLVEAMTGSRLDPAPKLDTAALAPIADLDTAMALGLAAVPEGRLKSFRLPGQAGEPAILDFEVPYSFTHARAWVGDEPARVLAVDHARDTSAASRFWNMRYQLHVGDFGGWPVRVLWLVLSLMPAAFVGTGLWLAFPNLSFSLKRRGHDAATRKVAATQRGIVQSQIVIALLSLVVAFGAGWFFMGGENPIRPGTSQRIEAGN